MTVSLEVKNIRLVTERTVDCFLQRFFLRDVPIRNLCIVSPFISTMEGSRFTLRDLSEKIGRECIPTYVVTRSPSEPYQEEAIGVLAGNQWVEIRFNESVHAKVFISSTLPESESFALFGSGNLTSRSIAENIEVGMMIIAGKLVRNPLPTMRPTRFSVHSVCRNLYRKLGVKAKLYTLQG